MFSSVAPSAPPNSVTATSTPTTITVQWGMVPCIHRNGEITGYSVRYGVQGQSTQTMSVSGADTTEITISDLMSPTNYSIEVAAVNSFDTGPYSDPITVETPLSRFSHFFDPLNGIVMQWNLSNPNP